MLNTSRIVLWLGGALACLSVLIGGFFYVKNLQRMVEVEREKNVQYEETIRQNQKTIEQTIKDKAFDDKLLSELSKNKQEIRKDADERKAKVAKSPDGAAPPAIICAITGVCD